MHEQPNTALVGRFLAHKIKEVSMPYADPLAYKEWMQNRPGYLSKWFKDNPDKRREYDSQRDPVKVKARAKARYAVRAGKLLKKPCEICGDLKVQAHHEDYSKPLEVVWLCNTCHKSKHIN